ncbi:MAG TPA: response regulator [Myxococcaceae bacterium]|nr:response regulator [Myxococcaceae bacterium]
MARNSSHESPKQRSALAAAGSERTAPASTARAPAPREVRRGRILVIDDEPIVGAAVRRTLCKEHDVTVVGSGREALDLIASGQRFDLLLSDVMMPNMSGMELFAELAQREPEASRRMVFFTGGAFTERTIRFLEAVPNERLEKPFDPEYLRAFVRDHLR